MKVLFVLFILVCGVVGAAYYFGGFANLDPSEQAAQFRANVKPGMSWQEVAAVKKPKEYVIADFDSRTGEKYAQDYDEMRLTSSIEQGKFEDGFYFRYIYSNSDAIQIYFNNQGVATSVDDMVTMKDLLEGNAYSR